MQEREALSAELAAAKRVAATEGKEGLKEERAKLRARADKLTRALECVVWCQRTQRQLPALSLTASMLHFLSWILGCSQAAAG